MDQKEIYSYVFHQCHLRSSKATTVTSSPLSCKTLLSLSYLCWHISTCHFKAICFPFVGYLMLFSSCNTFCHTFISFSIMLTNEPTPPTDVAYVFPSVNNHTLCTICDCIDCSRDLLSSDQSVYPILSPMIPPEWKQKMNELWKTSSWRWTSSAWELSLKHDLQVWTQALAWWSISHQ